jgi:hypothetical protein
VIEVFKTNVENADESAQLIHQLHAHFPSYKINFDLEDCDRILRIEGVNISPEAITEILSSCHYQCEVLA